MWDERYGSDGYAYGTDPNDFIRAQAHLIPERGRVLCVAEGQGRNAVHLAELGHDVTAFDQSIEGVKKARALAEDRGVSVRFVHADAREFDVGEACWDAVVSVFAHMPPEIRQDLHRRLVNGLAPGGVLLLEAYAPAQAERDTGGPPDPALCMDLDTLRRELAGLEFEIARALEREVVEGAYHTGMAAVTQIVARKSPG